LEAIATDVKGKTTSLGTRTINCDNDNAIQPFGALDTPAQGGIASGEDYLVWGWALTPMPNTIPVDGSTIDVWVDGENKGQPVYNLYRSDIAALFPGYTNSDGAVGYFYLDTTQLSNGLHTIQWTVSDDAGNFDGIGSRYFTVQNTTNRHLSLKSGGSVPGIPLVASTKPISIRRGYNPEQEPEIIYPGEKGEIAIHMKVLQRLEIHLPAGAESIYPLPVGASLKKEGTVNCIFNWQLGPGFRGNHPLEFRHKEEDGVWKMVHILVTIKD
jgi:hypothetical protein